MKLAIVGGGSTYTPELIDGFARLRDVWVERAMPVVVAPVAAVVGESITAGHMLRLALQEASLQATYAALLPRLEGEAARVVTE